MSVCLSICHMHDKTIRCATPHLIFTPPLISGHVLRQIHHCTLLTRTYNIRSLEARQTNRRTINLTYPATFLNDLFITAQTHLHHYTFPVVTFCASLHGKTSPV